MLASLWAYRNFVLASIEGELKGRYARSKFGMAWFILHPLAQATIFAVVLSEVLAAKLPGINDKSAYAIYLMSGIAAWNLFVEIVTRCTNIFIEYGGTMKKISFPRLCLPIIVAGSALLNHVLLLLATVAVFLCFGHWPGIAWSVVPVGIVLVFAMAFGLGVLLAVFNVFSRDVAQVVGIVIQFWFWLTPVVYAREVLPVGLRRFVDINPMAPVVKLYQDALLHDRFPVWSSLVWPAAFGVVLTFLAFYLFRRAAPELVDAL